MIETPECDKFAKNNNEFSYSRFESWVLVARKQEQRAIIAETRLGRLYEQIEKLTKIVSEIKIIDAMNEKKEPIVGCK